MSKLQPIPLQKLHVTEIKNKIKNTLYNDINHRKFYSNLLLKPTYTYKYKSQF